MGSVLAQVSPVPHQICENTSYMSMCISRKNGYMCSNMTCIHAYMHPYVLKYILQNITMIFKPLCEKNFFYFFSIYLFVYTRFIHIYTHKWYKKLKNIINFTHTRILIMIIHGKISTYLFPD